jgi:hypothetical protein
LGFCVGWRWAKVATWLNCGGCGNTASWLIIVVVATLYSISKGGGLLVIGDSGHIPSWNALVSALIPGSLLFLLGHTLPDSSRDIGSWIVLVKLVGLLGDFPLVDLPFLGVSLDFPEDLALYLGLW